MSKLDLSLLNRPQLEAVLHDAGPLLVLAGAGSGKTRVITYRIARLIRDRVKAENILAVTFTNKSAAEMRERIGQLTGRTARKGLTASTFHALGHRMLRECPDAVGLMPKFSIFDQGEQLGTLKRIFREIKIDDRNFDAKRVLAAISKLKNAGVAPEDAPLNDGDDYTLITKEAYARYQAALRREQAVDFDDLLLLPVKMLRAHPGVKKFYRERFRYVMVDEYQDTNPIQFELLCELCDRDGNLCVVGDDDQAIYGFRGAEVAHILSFAKHFPGAKQIALTQNYRSTGSVLAAANAVIAKNEKRHAKNLWTSAGDGDPVEITAFNDEDEEAKFIVDMALRATSALGKKPEDIAVLYRSNVQSRPVEEALRLEHIPYRVVGGMEYYERKEVKDALAYLRLVDNPHDEISLRRIINYPARGVGEVALAQLAASAKAQDKPLYDVLKDPELREGPREALKTLHAELEAVRAQLAETRDPQTIAQAALELLRRVGLQDAIYKENENLAVAARKIENIEHITQALKGFLEREPELSFAHFLGQLSLEVQEESDDSKDSGVTLMTIHSAKGLEWPWVFIIGCEEDLLPHKRTMADVGGDLSEERRLCYVAITRARERLWMTYAKGRKKYGQYVERTPSRFLEDLGEGVRRTQHGGPSALSEEQQEKLADDFFAKMREKLGYG